MYNNGSYCCNSCRQNPIFYSFSLKKKFKKKKIHQKKSKNQNWPIFDFSLIGSSVFELEPKTAKLRKQVELCPQGCFYLLTKELKLWSSFCGEIGSKKMLSAWLLGGNWMHILCGTNIYRGRKGADIYFQHIQTFIFSTFRHLFSAHSDIYFQHRHLFSAQTFC